MKKLVILAVLLFSGCTVERNLPYKVTSKTKYPSGRCSLGLTDRGGLPIQTAGDERYCSYEIDQEIK